MNSFLTQTFTEETLKKFFYYSKIDARTLEQGRFPLMYKTSLAPVPNNLNSPHWYPPGSGEVFDILKRSGMLKQLLEEGKEYAFICDVENLGASIDFNIFFFLIFFKLYSLIHFFFFVCTIA